MRTKLAPGCAPSQASTVSICGTSAIAARFEIVAALAPVAERAAVDAVPAGEHLGGRQRHARVDQQHRRPGQFGSVDRRQLVARPFAPRRQAEQAGRHVAAELGRDLLPHAPDRCPTMTSAAAAPPPRRPSRRRSPRRPASFLSSVSAAPVARPPPLRRSARAAVSTRLSSSSPSSAANGPVTSSDKLVRRLRRSAGRHRCRRRRSSRSRAARRAACRGRGARG